MVSREREIKDRVKVVLNEYIESIGLKFRFVGWNRRGYFTNIDSAVIPYERICGKDYGFIKWLVENNRIDYSKAEEYCIWNDLFNNYRITREDGLIACLSIQPKQIEFLYSILW